MNYATKAIVGFGFGVTLGCIAMLGMQAAQRAAVPPAQDTDPWRVERRLPGDSTVLNVRYYACGNGSTEFDYDASIGPLGRVDLWCDKRGVIYVPVRYSIGPVRMNILLRELQDAGMYELAVERAEESDRQEPPTQLRSGDFVNIDLHVGPQYRPYSIKCTDPDMMARFVEIIEDHAGIGTNLPRPVVDAGPVTRRAG